MHRRVGHNPPMLTPGRAAEILSIVAAGNYFTTACKATGISHKTGEAWLNRGRAEIARLDLGMTDTDRITQGHPPAQLEEPYAVFAVAVEAARARAEVRVVGSIDKQIHGGWLKEKVKDPETQEIRDVFAGPDGRLGLEFLSRVHPTRWGRKQTIEVGGTTREDGSPGQPITVDVGVGVRLADSLRGFLDRVKADPTVLDVEPVVREIVAGPTDRSEDDGDG